VFSGLRSLSLIDRHDQRGIDAEMAGFSPLGSDHGTLAVPKNNPINRIMMLPGASDPRAVPRVRAAFGPEPDPVAGPTANPSAAAALVDRLSREVPGR